MKSKITTEEMTELESVSKQYATRVMHQMLKLQPDRHSIKTNISDFEIFIGMMSVIFSNQCLAFFIGRADTAPSHITLAESNKMALLVFKQLAELEFKSYEDQFGEYPNMTDLIKSTLKNINERLSNTGIEPVNGNVPNLLQDWIDKVDKTKKN